jgi:hypothetical protein
MRTPCVPLAVRQPLAAAIAALAIALPCEAQFYEKVDLGRAAVTALTDALDGTDPSMGTNVAMLAGCGDPAVEAIFEAMAGSANPASRVYGTLGTALVTRKGIDPRLFAALGSRDERGVVIREANITGILRESPVAALLAAGDLPDAAMLSLVAELDRRDEAWDPAQIARIATGEDPVAAGLASLLLRDGGKDRAGDPAPWNAFRARLLALPPEEREPVLRALIEASLLFEIRSAAPVLLEASALDGMAEELRVAAIGMALRISPADGIAAWRAKAASNRSQLALVRAGMQLLACSGKAIPPTTFDAIRNGNAVLEAMADAGAAACTGTDLPAALIKLLDSGHSMAGEWALVRAAELPPADSAPVWKHLLDQVDLGDPERAPTPTLVSGLARELMKSDPAAVRGLMERVARSEELAVAAMSGINDSRRPEAQELARAWRGKLPRAGEGLAVLVLARAGAPLSDADLDVLGRAAAGGGDLDAARTLQAAWFFARSRKLTEEAVAKVAAATAPAPATAPAETPAER